MDLKEELVLWYLPRERKYFLDCADQFQDKVKKDTSIELTTRLSFSCKDKDKILPILNLDNVCILPEAYSKQ